MFLFHMMLIMNSPQIQKGFYCVQNNNQKRKTRCENAKTIENDDENALSWTARYCPTHILKMVASVLDEMLDIIRDSASDIADLIDNDDNIEIID